MYKKLILVTYTLLIVFRYLVVFAHIIYFLVFMLVLYYETCVLLSSHNYCGLNYLVMG